MYMVPNINVVNNMFGTFFVVSDYKRTNKNKDLVFEYQNILTSNNGDDMLSLES